MEDLDTLPYIPRCTANSEKGLGLFLGRQLHRRPHPRQRLLPHFEKTLVDAGEIAWPDEIKRLHLDGALTFELRRLTITISSAAVSYGAYVNEFLRMSNLDRVTMRYIPKELPVTCQEANDPMDWELIRATRAAPA
jgi:hypothetical protein